MILSKTFINQISQIINYCVKKKTKNGIKNPSFPQNYFVFSALFHFCSTLFVYNICEEHFFRVESNFNSFLCWNDCYLDTCKIKQLKEEYKKFKCNH